MPVRNRFDRSALRPRGTRHPELLSNVDGPAPAPSLPTADLRTALDLRDPSSYTLDTSTSSGNSLISAISSVSGAPVNWAQATPANRPQFLASAGDLSAPAIAFGGLGWTANTRLVAASALLPSSGPIAAYALFHNAEASGAQALLDAQSGRRILSIMTTGSVLGYFDGAAYRPATPADSDSVLGVQCVHWGLQASGGRVTRGNSEVFTGPYTEGAWGGTVSLGTVHNAFAGPDVYLYALYVYAAAHDLAQQAAVKAYIRAGWGAGTGL